MPCYEELSTEPALLTSLENHLSVIDRLRGEEVGLEDDLLLSLLLLPWARKSFGVASDHLKIGEAFGRVRQIRDALKENLAHLDIKRAAKEKIAGKLGLLPLFEQNSSDKGWPRWLTKKSYFKDNLLFYHISVEADGGETVDADLFPRPAAKKEKPRPSRNRPRPRQRGRGPAWAPRHQKGGVFGFKR